MKMIILNQISLPPVEPTERCYDPFPANSSSSSEELNAPSAEPQTHTVRCLSLAKWQDDKRISIKLLLRHNAAE